MDGAQDRHAGGGQGFGDRRLFAAAYFRTELGDDGAAFHGDALSRV